MYIGGYIYKNRIEGKKISLKMKFKTEIVLYISMCRSFFEEIYATHTASVKYEK